MANKVFKHAVNTLLDVEGGFVDHPSDPGGATKYGISLRWYRAAVDAEATAETIKHLSRGTAVTLYHRFFWATPEASVGQSYDNLPAPVAVAVFHYAVNSGPKRAHEFLQKALKRVGYKLKIDGVLGTHTCNAARASDPTDLIKWISVYALRFYWGLDRPEFIDGWLRRALDTYGFALEAIDL